MISDIKYAKSKEVNIAYQSFGKGASTLILINGWISNLEECWNLPGMAEWVKELADFTKIILFDKRGVGLSDRVDESELPGLGDRMDDLRAIMDQEKINKATLLGFSEGGPMAIFFSVTYPQRVQSLILYGSFACWTRSPDNPAGLPLSFHEKSLKEISANWGKPVGLKIMAPSVAKDPLYQKAWSSLLRKSASPKAAKILYRLNLMIDVREILPQVKVPTLVMHRENDTCIPFKLGKDQADNIPGAKWIPLNGEDHFPWIGDSMEIINNIRNFIAEGPGVVYPETTFSTVLAFEHPFESDTDFYDNAIHQFEGESFIYNYYSKVGAFKSPGKALKCAAYIRRNSTKESTLPKMIIHTGICTQIENRISGPALNIIFQLLNFVDNKNIWVTKTTRNLLSKFLFLFEPGGEVQLPAFPNSFDLYKFHDHTKEKNKFHTLLSSGKLKEDDINLLLEIKKYLEKNYLKNISLLSISREFGINSFKLKYGFKAVFDIPVKHYIQELRLAHAHKLILQTNLSIKEISEEIGYQQQGNFSKAFSKKYGKKPVEFRVGNEIMS